ncbi:hypothetical protein [Streptomyces camelliae]|uniref:Histone deacetylase domain-containing protein n=1 Tax=Streptomyces camelliae TaxID=3004093 RepID=A0ABY7PH02_9ACTN|nr:hypothetical protein [Streptomyces sp. HUAS 2-6]WBO68937.1 hypothetical protein O1G22_42255 [Streptomyces sp. HUAS 2-6]
MSTGYVWHELFGWADSGSGGLFPVDPAAGLQPIGHHVAHADTKRRLHELVTVSGLIDHLERVEARHATEEEVLRVHTPEHVGRLRRESTLPRGGYEIAALAAGTAIELVEAVVTGRVDKGYALVHPCGHHAPAHTGMGFCMLNNVANAVVHTRAALGVRRAAVVDGGVHHGNGAQSVFWDEPDVLTLSVHVGGMTGHDLAPYQKALVDEVAALVLPA